MNGSLKHLFNPASVAVIGASNKIQNAGYSLFRNIKKGYAGKLYAVNPKRKKIQGYLSYISITKIEEKVELAIIATPAPLVADIVEDCGRCGVKAVIIISSGFKESGKAGEQLATQVHKTIQKYDMRLLGPNCLGFINPHADLNASFAKTPAIPGSIAFISQSGALCSSILDWAYDQRVGFSYFVSVGDMIDISFSDLIDYFANNERVTSIVIYMESLVNTRSFLSSARAFARSKPIIVLKSGISQEGAHAALSHTGNLSGNDAAFDAAFRRAGILRVETIEELFDAAQTLTLKAKVTQNKLAIVTNAGGPGVIATDALVKNGGVLAKLSPKTILSLSENLPKNASVSNPVDILGDAGPAQFKSSIEVVLADENTDGVVVIVTPQMMTDTENIARALINIENAGKKFILTCFLGAGSVRKAIDIVEKHGIRNYQSPEDATVSFMNMYRYSQNIDMLYETPSAVPSKFSPQTDKARTLLDRLVGEGKMSLNELHAKKILSYYDIPVTENYLAKSPHEAGECAEKLGFPAILKIISPDILHKTEVGGYKDNIHTKHEAVIAFSEIVESVKKHVPDAIVEGVLVEKMQNKRYELFLGSKKDPLFGPVIVFGMGGIAVEVFKDTASGLPPLNMVLAKQLIRRTKIFKLLEGYRSIPGINLTNLEFILYKFAYFVSDFPDIAEIDINPLAVDEKSEVVLDAKIVLDPKVMGKKVRPYTHMVISPYPAQYISEIRAKDGKKILLRPIRPEDESLEAEMFKTFSQESQRFRFFGLKKQVTHEILTRYTNIDYDREIAIIAETEEEKSKKMIGVVRIMADPNHETAELAIIIGDPWQGKGIGNQILDYGLSVAKKESIRSVYAYVLEDNYIMLDMFKKRRFTLSKEEDYIKAELNLVNS